MRQRVDGIRTGEHTRYFAVCDTLSFRAVLHHIQIRLHFLALLCCYHTLHILAFRRKHHEGNAEDGVCTGGENRERRVLPLDGKLHLCSFGATYPVTLCLFQTIRPVYPIQPLQ